MPIALLNTSDRAGENVACPVRSADGTLSRNPILQRTWFLPSAMFYITSSHHLGVVITAPATLHAQNSKGPYRAALGVNSFLGWLCKDMNIRQLHLLNALSHDRACFTQIPEDASAFVFHVVPPAGSGETEI